MSEDEVTMDRALALIRNMPNAKVLQPFLSLHAVKVAAEMERLTTQGELVGLSADEVKEVVDVWNRWYQATPWPLDWGIVSQAITHRAMGLDWKPVIR